MAKTHAEIKEERKKKIKERQKYLMENPEVYQRDFDRAFQQYLMKEYPQIDPEDCDNKFDPHFREDFIGGWSQEAKGLSLEYSLIPVWDPDGDKPPFPVIFSAAKFIRCQDDRIWNDQIKKNSIVDLPPEKVFGRFLIVEIDLSKPRREIEADIMGLVGLERKKLKITGSHHELVSPPEPKDRESSYTYKKMEVWKMVEKERQAHDEKKSTILWRIATAKTSEATDSYDEKKWNREVRKTYDALSNAYDRDKTIYYGN